MQLIIALIIATIIYLVQKNIYSKIWNKNLDVSIEFLDDYIECGEKSTLVEVVNNAKFLPLPVFHVKFSTTRNFRFDDMENASVTDSYHRNDVFSVMGNQKITRQLRFTAIKRGIYHINSFNVIARDFFMTRNFAMSLKSNAQIYVFPSKIKQHEFNAICNMLMGEVENKKSIVEDPYTFRGIREYDVSDSISKINWKATARREELMVNLYNHSSEQRVKILLNLETDNMVKIEYMQEICIELASSLSAYFLNRKIPVMLESNGIDVITKNVGCVSYGASLNHQISIDKYLARIGENAGLDEFFGLVEKEINEMKKDTTYIVVSSYCKNDLMLKLDFMKQQGMDIHMIVPYFDIKAPENTRAYTYGWEVKLVDT